MRTRAHAHTLIVLTALAWRALGAPAAGQTAYLYNPSWVEFDSPDHATCTAYEIEILPLEDETHPAALWRVLVADVEPGTVRQYRIPFSALGLMPAGRTFRVRVYALDGDLRSDVSEIAPEFVRFSTCVGASGATVSPLQVTLASSPPEMVVGQYATVSITVVAPEPVYWVKVDIVYDGLPAWYFISNVDLRGTSRSYRIGPFARAQQSLAVLEAVDARGCRTETTAGVWQVVR
jgi:hypothetical protein